MSTDTHTSASAWPVGSPEATLACWGKWQFEAEERAALDAYTQTVREMPDDRLSA